MAALRCTDLFVKIMCCLEPGTTYVASKFTAEITVPELNYWTRARFGLLRGSLGSRSAVCGVLPGRTFIAASHWSWQSPCEKLGLLPAQVCWLHITFFVSPVSVGWVALPCWTSAQRCQFTSVLRVFTSIILQLQFLNQDKAFCLMDLQWQLTSSLSQEIQLYELNCSNCQSSDTQLN